MPLPVSEDQDVFPCIPCKKLWSAVLWHAVHGAIKGNACDLAWLHDDSSMDISSVRWVCNVLSFSALPALREGLKDGTIRLLDRAHLK
jgi:hypothetical protein